MRDKNFINDDKKALQGTLLGFFGDVVAQLLLILVITIIASIVLSIASPGLESAEVTIKISDFLKNNIVAGILGVFTSLVVLLGFVFIIGKNKLIRLVETVFTRKALIYGVGGFLSIIAFMVLYNVLVIQGFGLDTPANQDAVVDMVKARPITSFLLVCVLGVLIEELTYRYSLFGGLLRKNKVLAYVISALVFMFIHSIASFSAEMSANGTITSEIWKQMATMPPYAFSGLVLCYIYDKSESLGSPLIAHFLNNFLVYIGVVLPLLVA